MAVDLKTCPLGGLDHGGAALDFDGLSPFEANFKGAIFLEYTEDAGHGSTLPANASRGHQQVKSLTA